MSTSRRNTLLANVPVDTWPGIDVSVLTEEVASSIEKRVSALKLYAAGRPHEEIGRKTGVTRQEISRLVRRCTSLASDGQIEGFRALYPGRRIAPYERSAPVIHEKGSGSAGCAGALGQLFNRFPDLRHFIEKEFLRSAPTKKTHDVRVRHADLHTKFIEWLQLHGVESGEWPFNTSNEGAEALRRYCNQLLNSDPGQWIAARSGDAASRRNRLGTGVHRAFQMLRPFGAVQLDFHKIDAASVIAIENSFGVEIEVPLARWHIGLILEERLELILGAVVALEITPSSDSVLETIECSLAPYADCAADGAIAIGMNGRVFPNQLFEQLRGQCFSVLRMDNGWSNTAVDVINNVVDVVGCAVNFGPVRCWWGRDAIERVFGQMTRESLQRGPSTYGASAQDSRRRQPNANAEVLRIRLRDLVASFERVIARHNATRTEALSMASPLAALEAAMDNPRSLFIPAPLPKVERDESLVMFKTLIATIRGNPKIGERPYVKIGRWRYSNQRLALDYSLIGKEVKAYCAIRDARVVCLTLIESGENLGRLVPPRRWAHTLISFRDRGLFFRAGSDQRRAERREHGTDWLPAQPTRSARSHDIGAREALDIARQEIEQSRAVMAVPDQRPDEQSEPDARGSPARRKGRLFSLDSVLEIDAIINEE